MAQQLSPHLSAAVARLSAACASAGRDLGLAPGDGQVDPATVWPSAAHLALLVAFRQELLPALYRFEGRCQLRAVNGDDAMDAAARALARARRRVTAAGESLRGVSLRSSAGGHPELASRALAHLNRAERLQLRETPGARGAPQMDSLLEASAAIRGAALAIEAAGGPPAAAALVADATVASSAGHGQHGPADWTSSADALLRAIAEVSTAVGDAV